MPGLSKYYEHPDRPGEGAKRRKNLKGQKKVHVVMGEFKRGTLRSGSGEKVKNRDQAIAIAMSEAGMSKKMKSKMPKGAGQSPAGDIGAKRQEESVKVGGFKSGPTVKASSKF